MARNTYRKVIVEEEIQQPQGPKGFWESISDFDVRFNNRFALKMLPYLVYLAFFGVIYISNRHNTDKMVRKISHLRAEVDELRIEYTALKAEFVMNSKRKGIVKRAAELNLKETEKTPVKIVVKKPLP